MKMESVEFYAELLYKSKMLGGPKEFDKDQVQRLYEIRRQMGLPGRHPANLCQNKGKANCHNCGSCGGSEDAGDSQELVAAITKKVLEQLGK
jgi:L-fuculose-phosphate aldolase